MPVKQLTLDGEFVAEFSSCCEAVRQTGITTLNAAARNVLKGIRNVAGGYRWEFVNV